MSARRILKPSIVICIALGVFLLIYVRPLTLLSTARWKTRAKPEFWIVPRPLADVFIEQTAGRNFTFYGYQFEVPWTDVKREEHLKRTPRDLHLSLSRQRMVSSSVLLMLKPMWTGTLQGGLYSFQTEWLRGFQQGDPTRDKTVTIDAFDAHDHEIELSVGCAQGASQNVTQSELNRIIYSLRPILASQAE
jgi:hypothetical protein